MDVLQQAWDLFSSTTTQCRISNGGGGGGGGSSSGFDVTLQPPLLGRMARASTGTLMMISGGSSGQGSSAEVQVPTTIPHTTSSTPGPFEIATSSSTVRGNFLCNKLTEGLTLSSELEKVGMLAPIMMEDN